MTQAPTTHALGPDFDAPITDRWFEDYAEGAVYEFGHVTVSESEMIDFSNQWDVQPIHIDRDFASSGPFSGIIASGWHTGAIAMRLFTTHYISHVASLASPGLDHLSWSAPLRPGDTISTRFSITSTRRSNSQPDRGLVKTTMSVRSQDDVEIMQLGAVNFVAIRP